MFSLNNIDENFSKNYLQPFGQYTQVYRSGSIEAMSSTDPNLLGGFNDDKSLMNLSSNNATLSKTFRTIRKHLTRTTNKNDNQMMYDESDINSIGDEFNPNFPKQTITSVTIQRTLPGDKSLSSFNNESKMYSSTAHHVPGTYTFEYTKEKFPKEKSFHNDEIHQSTTSKHSSSTTFTSYQTRSVTVHSNSGARLVLFSSSNSLILYHERDCCLTVFFDARNSIINRLLMKNDIELDNDHLFSSLYSSSHPHLLLILRYCLKNDHRLFYVCHLIRREGSMSALLIILHVCFV
jgi:hypothetical protein